MRSLIRLVSLRARVAVLDGRHRRRGPLDPDRFRDGPARQRRPALDPVAGRRLLEPDDVQAAGRPDPGSRCAQPVLGSCAPAATRSPTSPPASRVNGFLLEREIPSLRQLDGPAWSVERGAGILGRAAREAASSWPRSPMVRDRPSLRSWTHKLGMAALVFQVYPEAKRALIAQGRPPSRSRPCRPSRSPPCTRFRQYEQFRDEFFKWTSLPYYQGYKGMDDALASFARGRTEHALQALHDADSRRAVERARAGACRNDDWTRSSASRRSGCTRPFTASSLPGSRKSPKRRCRSTARPESRSSTGLEGIERPSRPRFRPADSTFPSTGSTTN